jgi:hypothetical protein
MLSEILNSFKTGEPQDLEELAQRLGTERSALEGMLMTLVRQGKLKGRDVDDTSASGKTKRGNFRLGRLCSLQRSRELCSLPEGRGTW